MGAQKLKKVPGEIPTLLYFLCNEGECVRQIVAENHFINLIDTYYVIAGGHTMQCNSINPLLFGIVGGYTIQ